MSPIRALLLILAFAWPASPSVFGQEQDSGLQFCTEIRQLILDGRVEALADRVSYPLVRPLPIPPINTRSEFILYFPTLFDDSLRRKLAAEEMNAEAVFSRNGSHALLGGGLWITWDGKLQTVNHFSAAELQLQAALLAEMKQSLHPSLADFESQIVALQSAKFTVRIDQMAGGELRYSSWGAGKTQAEAPSLVLLDGDSEMKGTMGGERYSWKSGDWEYIVDNNRMAERDMMGWHLYVLKQGKEKVHEVMKPIR